MTTTPTPTPTPFPVYTGDPNLVTPGVLGFIAIAAIAIVTVLLIIDMTRRVRRVRYRSEIRDLLAEEQDAGRADASAGGQEQNPADDRGVTKPAD